MSSKKDNLLNIGGFLALLPDLGLARRARALLVVFEGLQTYGGMAGRDMEALATGIREMVEEDHVRARVGQVEYLGVVSAGRDPEAGDHQYPKLELVRLTIPRRVSTQAHMDVVAESVMAVHEERERIGGLRFTYEPDDLRFFQARFEPLTS